MASCVSRQSDSIGLFEKFVEERAVWTIDAAPGGWVAATLLFGSSKTEEHRAHLCNSAERMVFGSH